MDASDGLLKDLASEESATIINIMVWKNDIPEHIQLALDNYQELRLTEIETDRKNAFEFKKAVKAVAEGHNELADSVDSLNSKGLIASIKP